MVVNRIKIRKECREDYRKVEELLRDAFWDIHTPGATEHYLAHQMREHEDFVPELDLVAEIEGVIVGSIMYTVGTLTAEDGTVKKCLSFGPLGIHPNYQRQGIGKMLIERSFEIAREMGYDTVIIFGHPGNYVARGFVSSHKLNICVGEGYFPTAMLVKVIGDHAFDGKRWVFEESKACEIDEEKAEEYDKLFPKREKHELPCQEEFYIYSRSSING